MGNIIKLFENKKDCCGCSACRNVCPQKAIFMKEDGFGFLYPEIDSRKCIECGLCLKVCGYHSPIGEKNKINAYAMLSKEEKLYNKSASGGAFAVMAQKILDDGGYVVGCSMEKEGSGITAKHIIINDKKDLYKLQGSKYVQSDMGQTYYSTKKILEKGKCVLFSGTPCQIASLKKYLNKEYNNLITIDLVCHGVPSQKMFRDYLNELEQKYRINIEKVIFRDKSAGWGLNGFIVGKCDNGKKRKIILNNKESSYYYIFQQGLNYRKSCYSCPFAGELRPGDITIGDYWGIEVEHPELFSDNNAIWKKGKGISCIVVHSQKGKEFLEKCEKDMRLYQSTYEKVSRNNSQLLAPTVYDNQWQEIMNIYCQNGYVGIEKWFKKKMGISLIIIKIRNRIPKRVKKLLHKIFD